MGWVTPLTPLARWQVAAPRQVPVAHEQVGTSQLEARVAVEGDDGAVQQLGLRGGLPAVGDVGQLRARVVAGHLCGDGRG